MFPRISLTVQHFAETAEAIAATTKKTEKIRILGGYFRSCSVEEAAISAVYFSGRPFPAWEETTLQVGGRLLWRIVAEISGQPEHALGQAYARHGDLGAATFDVLSKRKLGFPALTTPGWPTLAPRSSALGWDRDGAHKITDIHQPPKTSATSASKTEVLQTAKCFRAIATAQSPAKRASLVRDLLSRATPLEAKYLVKIMTGELRIGLKESLVEEAIAAAYDEPVRNVQRANMLLGDIGQTLRLAAEHRLDHARMRLFHPIGFMLASPVDSAREAFEFFQHAQIEDKYDGIRAQAHVSSGEVRLFSRTLDEVTESFPELVDPLSALPDDTILDGEILAWDFNEVPDPRKSGWPTLAPRSSALGWDHDTANTSTNPRSSTSATEHIGRALPFSALQKRLGRKRPTSRIMDEVPVAYVVFDVLYTGGELVIEKCLRERTALLDSLFEQARSAPAKRVRKSRIAIEDAQGTLQFEPVIMSSHPSPEPHRGEDGPPTLPSMARWPDDSMARSAHPLVLRAPVLRADSPEHLSELFERAQARGNEGLMIKDINSPYTPGRRGKSWLKLKRELATLDVVVTAVERGHGKRVGVLSDYTFAVRDPSSAMVPHISPPLGDVGPDEEASSPPDLPTTPSGDMLLNIGKAYSGLTDAEIAEMTRWFEEHTIEDNGWVRQVEPKIVIEVAFNAVMRSDRHNSGYALRFPRILRLRPDKSPDEADTLDRLREIYERQHRLAETA